MTLKQSLLLLILWLPMAVCAQQVGKPATTSTSGWYIGADAGISLGRSTFSSFSVDKTRVGFGFGLLGGYHINNYLSLEGEVKYSHLSLGTYDCCQNLYLASDGNRYYAPLAGANNYLYSDLQSSVGMYQVGLRMNIDFIRLFRPDSRWSFLVSPAIYDICAKATVKTIEDTHSVWNPGRELLFGAGADLGMGYQINNRVNIRLYTGVIGIMGGGIDALPQTEHTGGCVWNTGAKVTFAL